MELQEVGKFILYVAIAFSLLGVSVQLMRLINALTANIYDLRKTIQNVGILTDGLVEDQGLIKQGLEKFVSVAGQIENMVDMISSRVVKPFVEIFGFLKVLKSSVERISNRFS